MHEQVELKSANRIVSKLATAMNCFAMVVVYVSLVQTYLGISFVIHVRCPFPYRIYVKLERTTYCLFPAFRDSSDLY